VRRSQRREGCGLNEGGSVGNDGRSEAGKESRDIALVGDSEGAGRAVVGEGEAEKFGGEGVGFGVIEC
jgi:hypothetical protein